MSLDFSYHGTEDTKKWSKADWQFYNALIWATMMVDLNGITEKNIDEFVRRVNETGAIEHTVKCKCGEARREPMTITKEEITKFIGLRTNVHSLTARQWAIKRFGREANKPIGRHKW